MGHQKGFITLVGVWSIYFMTSFSYKRYIDRMSIYIILFAFTYSYIGVYNGFMTIGDVVGQCLPLLPFYLFGSYLKDRVKSESIFSLLLLLILIFYAYEIYYTILYDITETRRVLGASREFYFYGDEDRKLTATLVGLNVSLGMVGFPACIIMKNNKILRLGYFVVASMSLLTTIHLQNRTGLIVAIACTISVLLYYFKDNIVKVLVYVLGITFLGVFLFKYKILSSDIIRVYSERNEYDTDVAGGRTRRWYESLDNLFSHPFGDYMNNMEISDYAHNMWLDIAKVTGLFPFVFLCLITLLSFRFQWLLCKYTVKNVFVGLSFGIFVAFILSSFVEPLYGGLHMFIWLFICGTQKRYIDQKSIG